MPNRLTKEEIEEIDQLDKEILHRLWIAISEIFLDTELQEESFRWIAEELAASRLSPGQLSYILENQVAPLLAPNVLSVAGEWTGFDKDWLVSEIEKQRKVSLLDKATIKLALNIVSPDWRHVLDLLEKRK